MDNACQAWILITRQLLDACELLRNAFWLTIVSAYSISLSQFCLYVINHTYTTLISAKEE